MHCEQNPGNYEVSKLLWYWTQGLQNTVFNNIANMDHLPSTMAAEHCAWWMIHKRKEEGMDAHWCVNDVAVGRRRVTNDARHFNIDHVIGSHGLILLPQTKSHHFACFERDARVTWFHVTCLLPIDTLWWQAIPCQIWYWGTHIKTWSFFVQPPAHKLASSIVWESSLE